MLEQGFANTACGFKLPTFPEPSPVIFSTRSRSSLVRDACFCQLVTHLTYLMSSTASGQVRSKIRLPY
jgi:hypothetical protein